jgi:hypothetical protein
VREEVERTVLDPAEVDAELHGLCEALVQAEGRVRASLGISRLALPKRQSEFTSS